MRLFDLIQLATLLWKFFERASVDKNHMENYVYFQVVFNIAFGIDNSGKLESVDLLLLVRRSTKLFPQNHKWLEVEFNVFADIQRENNLYCC